MARLHLVILSALFIVLINETIALKCATSACDTVRCANPECGPGEEKGKGGHCLCCDVCRKIIGENEYCGSGSPIGGVISDTVTCGPGLHCKQDKCQKFE